MAPNKGKTVSSPQVVVYSDPRKRKRSKEVAVKPNKEINPHEIVSMKDARFDVYRFGLGGMNKGDKANAEITRLINLGAKPAKKKCYNSMSYPEFKQIRKKEKEEARKTKGDCGIRSTNRKFGRKKKK